MKGRTFYDAYVAGVRIKFSFQTPYHYLIARQIHRGKTENELLLGWAEASICAKRIYDVGGFNGIYGLLAAIKNPRAQIVIFEPDEINCAHIAANIRLNDVRNCTLLQAAISDTDGTIRFSQGGSTGERISTLGKEVRAIALHSFPPADLVKLDVEGAELRAIRGLGDTPARILLEVHPEGLRYMGDSVEALWDEIHRHGYKSWLLNRNAQGKEHHLLFR